MNDEIRDPTCLCVKCFEDGKEKETQQVAKNKADQQRSITEALAKARECKFFSHVTLPYFDKNGKEVNVEPQMTCTLTIMAKCGHETLKHTLCNSWRNGDFCQDWKENRG